MPMRMEKTKRSFLFLIFLSAICILLFSGNGWSLDKDKYPDYLIKRQINFHGTGPALEEEHWLTLYDRKFSRQITYEMDDYRALLVQLRTDVRPTSVIMLASTAGTPRVLRLVWRCDDLRDPIVFWTDRYWISDQICNATGCPKIRFQVIRGGVDIKIIKRR